MQPTLNHLCSLLGVDLPSAPSKHSPIEVPSCTRDDLARHFHALGFKVGAEVGVEVGRYSKVLLQSNPGLKLFCVDAWAAYSGYREHVTQSKVDGFLQATRDRLDGLNFEIVRAFSLEAAKKFKPKSLDFVYIDANHALPYVIADIAAWEPIVRPGGILCGHDFARRGGKGYQCHVIEAVHAWTAAYNIAPWFVIGPTEPGPNGERPTARSWAWVKG